MAKKNKFEKLGVNENYIDNDTADKNGENKSGTRENSFNLSASGIKDTFSRSGKTFIKKVKSSVKASDGKAKVSPPSVSPFILLIVIAVLHFTFSTLVHYGAFSGFSSNKYAIIEILAAIIIYIVPAAVFIFSSKKRKKQYYFNGFSARLLSVTAMALILVMLQSALQKCFIAYNFSYREPVGATAQNLGLVLLTTALVPAICEELVLRGVLQFEFTRYGGGITGIFACALFFAILHFDLQYFMIYFTAGILIGIITYITGSAIPAVLIHLCNNGMTVLLSDRLTFVSQEKVGGTFLIIILASLCFIFLMIFIQMLERISRRKASLIHKSNSVLKAAEAKKDADTSDNSESSEKSENKALANKNILKKAPYIAITPVQAKKNLQYFEKNRTVQSLFSVDGNTPFKFLSVLLSPLMLACYVLFIIAVFFMGI